MIKKVLIKNKSPLKDILKYNSIKLNPSVNVLLGINGAGKTSLINAINSTLNDSLTNDNKYNNNVSFEFEGNPETKVIQFKGREDNGKYRGYFELNADSESIVTDIQSKFISEGESSIVFFNRFIEKKVQPFLESKKSILLLIDELDSGLSVNYINYTCQVLHKLCEENNNLQVIISSNNYETARLFYNNLIWVHDGKKVKFNSYDEYKNKYFEEHEKRHVQSVKK